MEKNIYESYLIPGHYDLITPDGVLAKMHRKSNDLIEGTLIIEDISPAFVGFDIDIKLVEFNLKSTLAQIGLEGRGVEFHLDKKNLRAEVLIHLTAMDPIATDFLNLLKPGAKVGKLFAADDRRRVRDPDYLLRMFGRSDRWGRPLLSLGGMHGSEHLILDKVDGRTVAYLTLQNGVVEYDSAIYGFLPTLGAGLHEQISMREMLKLHQVWKAEAPRHLEGEKILLVKTLPLHIRTVFGKVVDNLVAAGYKHTSANVLQPDTSHSGDIYEFYGHSKRELTDIPLEFYTLEPHREYVFFQDRDQLQLDLENSEALFKAFETSPKPKFNRTSVFIVKGTQLSNLKEEDWIIREPQSFEFPGPAHPERQSLMIQRYIHQQPSYPFLKAIETELITSQGVLLSRYLPSPLMKRMLLGNVVQKCLKGIYFKYPSLSNDSFFSDEDRALLNDLVKFAIPVFWVDEATGKVLQYTQRRDQETGMFVPLNKVQTFLNASVFGVYGSNLLEGDFEKELVKLMKGLLELRDKVNHPLLHADKPLALVTGGGPGAMEVGNRVARELNILSCGNIVDFRTASLSKVHEQLQNPHVEAKMTYRLNKIVERQADFNLDFPIFLTGGIGTDFEFSLEEVRRKVSAQSPTPVILFGAVDYWREKISHRFQANVKAGTIRGSEWLSNCFYCIQNGEQGLRVYERFFQKELSIGPGGAVYSDGFCSEIDKL
jgi:predicted Rossmann-fold nucleotide-binding protein